MEVRTFGKNRFQGKRARIWRLGKSASKASARTVAEKILGAALDAGINVIDTAECYQDSEELIGKGISHRRGDYHLFTKCGHVTGALDRLRFHEWDPRLMRRASIRA